MKKMVIAALAVVLAISLLIGMPLWWKMERVSYENELLRHFADAISSESFEAEYNGVRTRLCTANIERLLPCLTRSERNAEFFHSRENTGESVVLRVDGEMCVELEQPDPAEDLVYIYYSCGSRRRTLSIQGYDTMNWVIRLISPEGMCGPNTEIA